MGKVNISELRRRYMKGGLTEVMLPEDPLVLLRTWVEQALEVGAPEPNAMSLATVKKDGIPDVRTVLLKGIEKDSVLFYTNYRSEKAADLEVHPYAGCCFWWPELERQVRLKGPVEKVSRQNSAEYFSQRPRESQIGAWASAQSRVVSSRDDLEKSFEEFRSRFEGKPVPVPETWGGYRIRLSEIEFWQGRPGRMHDRIRFRKQNGSWQIQRLAP